MSKNNVLTVGLIVAILGASVFFLFFLGKKNSSPNQSSNSQNHMANANVSASFDGLMNKQAPEFSLSDRQGNVYSLESLKGKNIILFFNEGLMCYPACWDQVASLGQDSRFGENNTVALSVVIDAKEEWQKAISQMPSLEKATIVFDKGAEVSKRYNMLETPSSMHYGIFPGHTYVLIDKQGVVRFVLDDPNMANHNDQLITEIKKLN